MALPSLPCVSPVAPNPPFSLWVALFEGLFFLPNLTSDYLKPPASLLTAQQLSVRMLILCLAFSPEAPPLFGPSLSLFFCSHDHLFSHLESDVSSEVCPRARTLPALTPRFLVSSPAVDVHRASRPLPDDVGRSGPIRGRSRWRSGQWRRPMIGGLLAVCLD